MEGGGERRGKERRWKIFNKDSCYVWGQRPSFDV